MTDTNENTDETPTGESTDDSTVVESTSEPAPATEAAPESTTHDTVTNAESQAPAAGTAAEAPDTAAAQALADAPAPPSAPEPAPAPEPPAELAEADVAAVADAAADPVDAGSDAAADAVDAGSQAVATEAAADVEADAVAPAPTPAPTNTPTPSVGDSPATAAAAAAAAPDATAVDTDPDAGLGLPDAGAILGPPNLGGFESGEIIPGTVLTVSKREAEVDLGDGKVGVISDRHWDSGEQVDLTSVVKTGDTVEAAVLARADVKKRITLSRLWAQQKRGWEAAEAAAKDKSDLSATVTETVKGGLSLDVGGLRGFMPASLADLQTVNDLTPLIGQTFDVRVVEADRNKARLIVSRKASLRATQRQQAKSTMASIEIGQAFKGTVAQITDFGAFVDVNGVRGLVHKSEIGWSRARDPQRDLKVGQEVDVTVIKVQPSKNRLGLSMRSGSDPLTAMKKGTRFEGSVSRLVDFGAFVELPEGGEGLVHVSEMAEYRVFAPEEIVVPGDKVWVKVIKIDKKRRTIDLSMSQAVAPDPASETAADEAAAAAAAAEPEPAVADASDQATPAVDDAHAEDAAGADAAAPGDSATSEDE